MKNQIWERIFVSVGVLVVLGCILLIDADFRKKQKELANQKNYIDTVLIVKQVPEILEVSGTCYNPVPEQCDATPLYTTDGSYIDTVLLREGKIRWIAISQDLLMQNGGPFRLGDTIITHHPDATIRGQWIIHDCMNARSKRYIDFLVDKNSKLPHISKHILISKEKFYD